MRKRKKEQERKFSIKGRFQFNSSKKRFINP